MNLLTWNSYFL